MKIVVRLCNVKVLHLTVICMLFMGYSITTGFAGVAQSARNIPVIKTVDVVVVGGSTAGVSAAVSAAEKGARVFLVAPRSYLGEDLCATMRLRLEPDRKLETSLEKELFASGQEVTLLHVKKTLDETLLNAGVEFMFWSYVTDVLQDAQGNPCGVVIANRAGRQVVIAKVIIDATDRSWICRMAGAQTSTWAGGMLSFQRITVALDELGKEMRIDHALRLPMPDLRFASFAEADQLARDRTFTEQQLRSSESMFYVPPDHVVCRKTAADWRGALNPSVGHFQPAGIERLYVLGGCADIPRDTAENLLRPAAMTGIGMMLGVAAANESLNLPTPRGVKVKVDAAESAAAGDIKEILHGARPTDSGLSSVPSALCSVPLFADYDVVVVGGGTSGASAAIGAARQGARVLVLEYQEGLGGVGTLGMIGKSYHGLKVGFSEEVPFPSEGYTVAYKMNWYREEIRKAGGDIWFRTLGCGVFVEGNQVRGAVVCTPEGRGVVTADVVIDATGNADVAIAAGADYMYGATEAGDIALQGTGLPNRPLNKYYVNTDYLLVDESDMTDVWRALVGTRLVMDAGDYDVGTLIQNRERRRVVGDHVLRYIDQIAGRTYPDAIVYSSSDYDSHGYPTSRFFALLPHDERSRKENHPAPGGSCYTPYRCLLPRGLEGLLVVGLGMSMERDASAMVRMQFDMQNQGYAAGVAAALAVEASITPRQINVRQLQEHLVEKGNLPEIVLNQNESFPLSSEIINQAVNDLAHAKNPQAAGYPLAVILTHKEAALPLLRQAYIEAEKEPGKLSYAQILGFLGHTEGLPTLLDALGTITEWDSRILQGRMAEYAHLPTPQDAVILALGYAGDRSVTPELVKLISSVDATVPLSHHRAFALAFESLRDPAAVKSLAQLLNKRGMRGHAMTQLEPLHNEDMEQRRRLGALREIVLARALYQCGDYQGLGESILREYEGDIRGLFSRHAQSVLRAK
jgi:flavin-dependent dehydrogenase